MPYKFRCQSLRLVPFESNLKAFADVQIGPFVIRDWRIVQQEGQNAYVAVPQTEYFDKQADKKMYKPMIIIPDDAARTEIMAGVTAVVLPAYDDKIAGYQSAGDDRSAARQIQSEYDDDVDAPLPGMNRTRGSHYKDGRTAVR